MMALRHANRMLVQLELGGRRILAVASARFTLALIPHAAGGAVDHAEALHFAHMLQAGLPRIVPPPCSQASTACMLVLSFFVTRSCVCTVDLRMHMCVRTCTHTNRR
ncbi:MAG: hypothetical protein ACPIOQ_62015, partial [Promethearchaeia archaeon]